MNVGLLAQKDRYVWSNVKPASKFGCNLKKHFPAHLKNANQLFALTELSRGLSDSRPLLALINMMHIFFYFFYT